MAERFSWPALVRCVADEMNHLTINHSLDIPFAQYNAL